MIDTLSEVLQKVRGKKSDAVQNEEKEPQENDLARVRSIVSHLISALDNQVKSGESPPYSWFWGEEESAVSVLSKLPAILFKLLATEQKITLDESRSEATEDEDISAEDLEFISRYINESLSQKVIDNSEKENNKT